MNFGRGFQAPRPGGTESCIPATPQKPIPVENGIGQNSDEWNPVISRSLFSQGNGVDYSTESTPNPERIVPQGNGIVQNNDEWNLIRNLFSQGNGIDYSTNSWTPLTPEKSIPQRSNMIPVDIQESQTGNEDWQALIGLYTDVLKEDKPVLDVAQDSNPNPNPNPKPVTQKVQKLRNRNSVVGKAKKNVNRSSFQKNDSEEASDPISFFPTNDPANWNSDLLTALVGPKKSSTCVSSKKKLPADRFSDLYRPCYNQNSPPRSEPDAAASNFIGSFSFTAIAPDNQSKNIANQRASEKVNFSTDETSTPADQRVPMRNEDEKNQYNELLQTIGDSSSSVISPTRKEHEEGDEQGIDLNKTPMPKTPARRKKHRPRVIREGKPKRTPKPKDPKNSNSNETPPKRKYVKKNGLNVAESQSRNGDDEKSGIEVPKSVGKRKYVKKKGLNISETQEGVPRSGGKRKYVRKKGADFESQQKNGENEVTAPVIETPAKSCKKHLDFDMEFAARDESQDINGQKIIHLDVNPQDKEQERRIDDELETSVMKIGQQIDSTGALNVVARNLTSENSITGQKRSMNGYNQVNQHVSGDGIAHILFQESNAYTNPERVVRPMLQNTPQSLPSGEMVNFDEKRGIKRQSFEQMHLRNVNAMDLLMYQKLLLGFEPQTEDSNNLASIYWENYKRKKMQSEFQSLASTEYLAPLEDNSRQKATQMSGIYRKGSAMELLNYCIGNVNSSCMEMDVSRYVGNCNSQSGTQKHQVSYGVPPHIKRLIAERSQGSTQGHCISSITAMDNWNPPPPTPQKEASRSVVTTDPATILEKELSAKPNSSSRRLNGGDEMFRKHSSDGLEGRQRSSTKVKGRPRKPKLEVSIDDITYKLECMCIYDENEKGKSALVPYRGNNAIIPFEPIKKRTPRPKVDLDPETDRIWRLLMEGSQDAETLDKDKEKWWENERRVFRGRAESFIARMHLVQGDRRFSRWKGSVVDSVIGVFLTQNVTDHLSSSAFMSLAAKFPPKSTTTNETCCQDGRSVTVKEPIEIVEPNCSMKCHENIETQTVFNQSSFDEIRSNKSNRISEKEVIPSQDSCDSSTIQAVDEIRSSSGSNSEAEDHTTGFETNKESGPPVDPIQPEKPSMFKELFSHDQWNKPQHKQFTNISGINTLNNSSIYTPSNSTIHLAQDATLNDFHINVISGLQLGGSSLPSPSCGMSEAYPVSKVTNVQNEMTMFEAPLLDQYNFLSNLPIDGENFQSERHISCGQYQNNHQHLGESFTETTGDGETLTKGKTGAQKQDCLNAEDRISVVEKQNCLENTVTEVNSKEQNYVSHKPPRGAGTNISKAKKGLPEDEQKQTIDWDNLRKQVLLNGEKKRSKDAMDSLDYEALRSAHVNEISDAIRDRGMNNLLADRMKDFLNRLVRDHGSIDLEWLRDAPPDKAKDYLLSFRGLGLKSVECVRLLTLHHLAFPVDTNVGRIAVRLGWVPLQPLPESLQLHLLEMYPVLETIQKYLWPRLCKLDQLTLYELHYQMITFGKVFCTKSKPNCNACPMRAECRHFASAFASARLALPGPEEKRIVTSDASTASDTTPPMVSRPMPLPPAENNFNGNAANFGRGCEPIIEEPTTPELETAELSISDIEDQYYEDFDEIPTIKLNMEEFTTNLQNIMQDSMDPQGDMSKALVALNPEAASIPTPKLKNVSRLRTEHLVYELPDSHPLLEGFDRREPDDPSPYLLAIWTPGETANSVQPPESGCPAQELGKLCDRTMCFSCNSIKEANSQVVRGTILIPCRTATHGSFPLNGTYFQVNEMFADHASSLNPIDVPRALVWNLPRRTVYFGTSVTTIFRGLTTEGIQYCFWRGFVCVRGFDQKTRAPKPLMARLHFPASKVVKTKNEDK